LVLNVSNSFQLTDLLFLLQDFRQEPIVFFSI
jgi:hypothetical protein